MSDLKKSFPPGIDCTLCFDFTPGWEAPDRLAKCDDLMLAPILPPRLSAEESQKKLARCEALLRTTPGVQHVLTLPENPFGRPRSQPRILLNLDPAVQKRGAREQLMRTIRARLEQEIEGVKVRLCGLPLGDFPIDLAISGPEADQVRKLGEKFVQRLAQSKSLTDVGSDPGYSPVPQLFVDVDRAKVKALGLSVKDVFNALQICLGGIDVNVPDFRRGNDTRWVQVQVDDRAGRKTIEEIAQLKIRSNHGEMVPLGTIAQVRQVSGPRVVDRLNLKPMVEITANPAPGVSLAEVRSVCESLADDVLRPSPAYRLTWLQELPLARRPLPEPRSGVTADLLRQVTVSRPVQRQVAHYEDLAGRVQPVESVVLRARVTGFLDKVSFKEGEDVKRGDLLFTIDSREFQSETVRAETVLSRAEGRRHQTAAALDRAKKLQASGALGQEELAKFQADRDDAEGLLREAQASLEVCKLKQSFCQVTAPISGRIGRSLLTPGNLVKADETILANIVSVDPMYVFFSLDERTVLRLRRLALEGKLKSPQKWELRVFLGMADEKGYPRQGTINFVDNRVDPNTGTLQVRAVFPNTDGMLLPGLFVRLRLPIGVPHEALLVPEKAIGSDQGQKFLYVVNQQNRVVFRRVLVVGAQHDGLRVIAEGLQLGERVILSDLDRVSPGVTVSPREVTVRAEPPKREE
jgi:RND family efflux transporter MFP subunit